jgi:hypothetical protein
MRIPAAVVCTLLLLAIGTYWAGEQTEVAVLRTLDAGGAAHDTKLWVVDVDGTPWVRVARPERSWLLRLRENPEVELIRAGVALRYFARPDASAPTRAAVDRAFREKYGWVDWWYGLVLREEPMPVALRPLANSQGH